VIERLLPSSVATAAAFDDPPGPATARLYPEEAAVVADAVESRQREFATVRNCARQALADLGLPPSPLLPDPRGAPRWPPGVVGSMTHCPGYRAAAVATTTAPAATTTVVALGIDAEPNAPLPEGVLDAVASAEERASVARLLREHPDVRWDRLLFSAKESVFKVWYPLNRHTPGFDEAAVHLSPKDGRFTAQLLTPGPRVFGRQLQRLNGRWLSRSGLLLTAITVWQ
jgi:4'-phosphopantetheinyl transferase EntD